MHAALSSVDVRFWTIVHSGEEPMNASSMASVVGVAIAGFLLSCPPATAQESTVKACTVENPPFECQNNMWALKIEIPVPNGAYVHVPDPGCMNETTGQVEKALQAAVAAGGPTLALFSGPIAKLAAGPVAQALKNQGGDIGRLYSPYAKNGALCAPMVAVVPLKAKLIGFRLLATDAQNGNVMKRCSPGIDCTIQWSKFQQAPVESVNGSMRTYTTIFMNWSHDRARRAQMILFYTLPTGEQPLREI